MPTKIAFLTGFKRTQAINRKKICDPDVPETQESYSQYANTKPAAAAAPAASASAKKKPKKRATEIDRLMGDEGAVYMIEAVELEQRELSGDSETRQTVIKPNMRKRALTITGRVSSHSVGSY